MVLTFANLVSRTLFSGFCPPPKPAKSTLGTVVGRLHMVRGTNFHKLAGATSSLTYDVFLSKLASLQILRRSFKWCRWIFLLPGPGQLVAEGSLLYPCQDFICKGIVTQEKYTAIWRKVVGKNCARDNPER